jgi:CRISPR-associated protein Csx17
MSAIRAIDSAIFDFCKYGGNSFFQRILVALGHAERELALTSGKVGQSKAKPSPLAGLSLDWIKAANDGSREFALALALASVWDPEQKIGPFRVNLEPVDWEKRCRAWAEKGRCVVWNAADLATNLASVLQRRLMDGTRAGCENLPLASHFSVPLDTVAAFLAGDLDDQRIEQLIWGLMLVEPSFKVPIPHETNGSDATPLPRAYALLKLLFLPAPLVAERSGDHVQWRLARRLDDDQMETGLGIRPEPRILPLLRAGRVGEACRIAAQRLRVSGLMPMPGPLPSGTARDDTWAEATANPRWGQRLAAALLAPISSKSVNHLLHLVCRADESAMTETFTLSAQGEPE